jgi:hypothetical protein
VAVFAEITVQVMKRVFNYSETIMTDLEKKIEVAEKKVAAMMKTAKWQRSVEKSDRQVDRILEKLKKDSSVDPKLLEEPATL